MTQGRTPPADHRKQITRNRIAMTSEEIEAAGELLEWSNGRGELVARLLAYCGWSRAEVFAEWDRLFAEPEPRYVHDPDACGRCRRRFTSRLKRSATVPALCRACRGVMP